MNMRSRIGVHLLSGIAGGLLVLGGLWAVQVKENVCSSGLQGGACFERDSQPFTILGIAMIVLGVAAIGFALAVTLSHLARRRQLGSSRGRDTLDSR